MIIQARETKNQIQIIKTLKNCEICYLGINDKNSPYIVPMNFGFTALNGNFFLYFSSNEIGKKINLLQKSPTVSFSAATSIFYVEDKNPLKWITAYQSIMGDGVATFIKDSEEKKIALKHIMGHYSENVFDFEDNDIKEIEVFKIQVNNITCRINPLKAI